MIRLGIDGDDKKLTQEQRDHIDQQIGTLDEYLDTLTDGHVTLEVEARKERTKVSAQVWGGGRRYEADATEGSLEAAVEHVRRELETQLTKAHSQAASHYSSERPHS